MRKIPVLSASEAADWDERARSRANIPSRVLMETAGRAVAWAAAREYPDALRHGALLAAGHGNNGGDGWVAARALAAVGVQVRVVEIPKERSPDCDANRSLALDQGVELLGLDAEWPRPGVVIDGLLGTGASGPPRGVIGDIAARIARHEGPLVAVDGPTGLDLSTGEAHGPIRATLSVTFGAARRGHLLRRDWCGVIVVADIGFPAADPEWPALVTDGDVAPLLPGFDATMHKGKRGRVLVIGGAEGMAGAALHAAGAALTAGAGLVKLAATEATVRAAQAHLPDALSEITTLGPELEDGLEEALEWADALVLGPGLGRGGPRSEFVRRVLESAKVPVIVDADALHAGLDTLSAGKAARVFTPHPGEFAAMFPDTKQDVGDARFEVAAAALARLRPSTPALLLKGVPTLIGAHGSALRVVAAGNPALATGGSGDLLAGFIGAFLARGLSPLDAATLGAQVLGRAAELAAADYTVRSTRPADVLAALPSVWRLWHAPFDVRPPELVRLDPPAVV
jgi:hydroxyethylthiazole kinase-like uncharacterized protein yjeF